MNNRRFGPVRLLVASLAIGLVALVWSAFLDSDDYSVDSFKFKIAVEMPVVAIFGLGTALGTALPMLWDRVAETRRRRHEHE